MAKTITIALRDNYSDWSDMVDIEVSYDEYAILRDFEESGYDEVWDKLCDRIERRYRALPLDWYIDHIYFV